MRCLYREKIHECGDYLEIDIFPVYKKAKSRGKKAKPTSEAQQKLNQKNAERKIARLANTNFGRGDIRFDLTYNEKNKPKDAEDAQRQMQNFLRRVKYHRKKHGMPDLKYIAVTEFGEIKGRAHHHIIMNGGVSIADLADIWSKGYVTVKPLQFNEFGIEDLAEYMIKSPTLYKRWNASKNLVQPKERQRDGRLSARRVKELCNVANDARREYEKLYEGYYFAGVRTFFNDFNGGCYLSVQMYRAKTLKKKVQRRTE